MNLSIVQTVVLIALWLIIGAFLDVLKLLIATLGHIAIQPLVVFASWLKKKRIGIQGLLSEPRSHATNLTFQVTHQIFGLFELLALFLITLLRSCFLVLTVLVVLMFFVPNLLIRILLRAIKRDAFYDEFLGKLFQTRLAGDETTDAPPPEKKKQGK